MWWTLKLCANVETRRYAQIDKKCKVGSINVWCMFNFTATNFWVNVCMYFHCTLYYILKLKCELSFVFSRQKGTSFFQWTLSNTWQKWLFFSVCTFLSTHVRQSCRRAKCVLYFAEASTIGLVRANGLLDSTIQSKNFYYFLWMFAWIAE